MKFSLATIALAAAAVASPTNPPPSGATCTRNGNSDGKVFCCNLSLLCNVLAIGQDCNSGQNQYCCDSNAQGGIINVDLLNCVNI